MGIPVGAVPASGAWKGISIKRMAICGTCGEEANGSVADFHFAGYSIRQAEVRKGGNDDRAVINPQILSSARMELFVD